MVILDDYIHKDDISSYICEMMDDHSLDDPIADYIKEGNLDDTIWTDLIGKGHFDEDLKNDGYIRFSDDEIETLMRMFEAFAQIPGFNIFMKSCKDYRAIILKFYEHFRPSTETNKIRATIWAAAEDQIEGEESNVQ